MGRCVGIWHILDVRISSCYISAGLAALFIYRFRILACSQYRGDHVLVFTTVFRKRPQSSETTVWLCIGKK